MKQPGGDAAHVVGLRRVVALAQDAFFRSGRFDCFKCGGRRAEVAEIGVGDLIFVFGVRPLLRIDGDEPLAAGNREGPEKHGVHERKYHGVQADAEREGDDDGPGKPAIGSDNPDSVLQIPHHGGWDEIYARIVPRDSIS